MRKFAIVLFIILLLGIDIVTKWFFSGVFQHMMPQCQYTLLECIYDYFPLVGEWIGIKLSYNSGVAFSLPIHGLPLQLLTITILAGIIYYYIVYEYQKKNILIDIGFSLVLAGAISHAYERIFIGYVVDFISVKYFAILNFADIVISIGACLILCAYYVRK